MNGIGKEKWKMIEKEEWKMNGIGKEEWKMIEKKNGR